MTDSHLGSVHFFYNYISWLTRICYSKSWTIFIFFMALSTNLLIIGPEFGKHSPSRRQSSLKRSWTCWRASRLIRWNSSLDNGCPLEVLFTIIILNKAQDSSSFFDKYSSIRMKSSKLKCSILNDFPLKLLKVCLLFCDIK